MKITIPALCLALASGLSLAWGAAIPPAQDPGTTPVAPPGAPADLFQKPYRVGYPVYEPINLVDFSGSKRDVLKEAGGKPVVLVFWALGDPLCHKYRPRLEALVKKYQGRVHFQLVASHHTEIGRQGPEPFKRIQGYLEKEKPVLTPLIDTRNTIADDFRMLCSGHIFVIAADGYLKFAGPLDNDPREKFKPETRTNYLDLALEETLAKAQITHPLMRPQGLRLKRHPDCAPRKAGNGSAPKPEK